MKEEFKTTYKKAWRDTAEWLGDNLYPETFEDYKNDMKYLFRGAWTHGNPKHVGELLKEVDSYDPIPGTHAVHRRAGGKACVSV